MPSSERVARRSWVACAAAIAALSASPVGAQQAVEGFALERFHPAPPGAGWLAMDALAMHGGLGGVVSLVGGYAHAPLVLATTDGARRLAPVAHQAFADIGLAVTYDRFRFSLDLTTPVAITGESGTIGGYSFTAPSVVTPRNPDVLSDVRLGVDARLVGDGSSPFRLGFGVQLFTPNGEREGYATDGTFRAMGRALVAGDLGALAWAGHAGVHVRPLDDGPAPGSPRGHELLFGLAVGGKLPVCGASTLVVGPEVFGETALREAFGATATGVEGLLGARIERTEGARLMRFKLGTGGAIYRHFGAPEWRVVFGLEVAANHPLEPVRHDDRSAALDRAR